MLLLISERQGWGRKISMKIDCLLLAQHTPTRYWACNPGNFLVHQSMFNQTHTGQAWQYFLNLNIQLHSYKCRRDLSQYWLSQKGPLVGTWLSHLNKTITPIFHYALNKEKKAKLKCLNFYGAWAPNLLKCLKLVWILELKSILCNLSQSLTIFDMEMVSYWRMNRRKKKKEWTEGSHHQINASFWNIHKNGNSGF